MSKGKCYSKVNMGQRKKNDCYQTPYSMTRALFENETFPFDQVILEPACGDRAIVKVIRAYNYKPFFYDKYTGFPKKDFLEEKGSVYSIVTNPPYSQALEFVKKAKTICIFKFAFLLKLDFLSGQKRYDEKIYDNLKAVYVFTRMPFLSDSIRKDGKYETGMQTYAWFVWDMMMQSNIRPIISWLDCKNFVAKKNEIDV